MLTPAFYLLFILIRQSPEFVRKIMAECDEFFEFLHQLSAFDDIQGLCGLFTAFLRISFLILWLTPIRFNGYLMIRRTKS